MDVTLQDVANVITFVAPGYFASKIYSIIYAKNDRELSRVVLESLVFSLPIVAVYDYLWQSFLDTQIIATDIEYVIPLLIFSLVLGWLFAKIRGVTVIKRAARHLNLPSADSDFIRTQFSKLKTNEPVTLTLYSDEVFSGTPQGGSVYNSNDPQFYYFNNVAWFDKDKKKWEDRPGSIILELSQVRYIETAKKLPKI